MTRIWKTALAMAIAGITASCSEVSVVDEEDPSKPVVDPEEEDDSPLDPCALMSCTGGLTCVDGICVNLRTDVRNCGSPHHVCGNSIPWCRAGVCLAECDEEDGGRICEGICVDVRNNSRHCGACNHECGDNMICSGSECICTNGYADWDGDERNGCETRAVDVECDYGYTMRCYSGLDGTAGVGPCREGVYRCEDGFLNTFVCDGEVLPSREILGDGIDNNCNGEIDEDVDADGDGWTVNHGDCCDSSFDCRAEDPARVNPGAIEVGGNLIDDDCDGIVDNVDAINNCSTANYTPTKNVALTTADALKLAQAMELCKMADSTGYGLVSAELLLADGTPLPAKGNSTICGTTDTTPSASKVVLISPAEQVAVVKKFGGMISPVTGATMAVLSSGKAQGNENIDRKDCAGTEVTVPSVYLNAHGGMLPSSSVCDSQRTDTRANDSVMLRLKLKAPTNAAGFKFKFKFFSKEYPAFVCDKYNDFFLALLTSKHPKIGADHNISFDDNNNPISVNNALFTECDKSACTKNSGCSSCEDGSSNVKAFVSDPATAGATRWLQTSAPIVPGETFTLDLMIFDAGQRDGANTSGFGHQQDSLVLLDDFEWTTEATEIKTVIY